VKRALDIAPRVRVMTVLAKGLEAPIVILADTTRRRKCRAAALLASHGRRGAGAVRGLGLGRPQDRRSRAGRDRAGGAGNAMPRRVPAPALWAMTRAAESLVITGSRGVNRIPDASGSAVDKALNPTP